MPSIRLTYLIIALGCTALIAVALVMQHGMELHPCYLCIVQRVFVISTGLIAFAAFLHNPQQSGRRIYGGLVTLSAVAGGGFSIRQLWLQSLPEEQIPACGPPVEYLFDAFSTSEALSMLFRGDGNCAEIQWAFMGISIPGWTLVAFIGLAALGAWQLLRRG